MKKLIVPIALIAAALAVLQASGSSHREAPNIMLDPSADNTDTYAFTARDAPDALTIVANWVPGGNPANGPNFFRFDDRARYYINIDNTGDGKADIRDRYVFKTQFSNSSYRYADVAVDSFNDPALQTRQRVSIVREFYKKGKLLRTKLLAKGLPVAPSNTGPKTFPDYGTVAAEAIRTVHGMKVFTGQRNDAFFIDLGVAFDNLNERLGTGNTGGGTDTQAGTNIQTITTQIPEAQITRDHKPVTGPDAANAVVGVWASTERRRLEVTDGDYDNTKQSRGDWVQVSRLGNPLVNELFPPAGLKDSFNRRSPSGDSVFKTYIQNPELARQLNGLTNPPGALNVPEQDRGDLTMVLLQGIPGLNQITKNPPLADELRINLGTPPAQTPNRFGVIGGDNAGYPNGRRLEDDVTDISLQVVGGYLKGNRLPIGDGVDVDDKPFLDTFPYQSEPDSGFEQDVGQRQEPVHPPTLPGNNPPTG